VPNVEQLKLIQAVITRLAGNSFLLKGWTVTLVAGLTAFAKADSERSFALIAVFAVAVLGVLDGYYLALERSYRDLYKTEAANAAADRWTLAASKVGVGDVVRAVFSVSIAPLYAVALGVAVGVALSA
jgi:hypothetical protein